jgi:hypothetical protein
MRAPTLFVPIFDQQRWNHRTFDDSLDGVMRYFLVSSRSPAGSSFHNRRIEKPWRDYGYSIISNKSLHQFSDG